jgi:hypothetical protein
MNIRFVKHEDIDIKKWDRCIRKAINGSLYGYSWYLDTVSARWDALIDENYEHVMPLTFRFFFGIRVLTQPHFATNLGVYSCQVLNCETVNLFISAIPAQYKYIRINLNKYNKITITSFQVKQDIHYELDLIQSYAEIRKQYQENVEHGLQKSSRKHVSVVPCLNSNDLIHLYQKSKGVIWNVFYSRRVHTLKQLVSYAVRYRVGQVYGAYDHDNNLSAAAFFIFSHHRATLLFLGINKFSLKEGMLEVIIDEFIKLHAEQNLTLRFEFASRKKFAKVYLGFGGRRYRFMNIRQNRLPWLFKFIRL